MNVAQGWFTRDLASQLYFAHVTPETGTAIYAEHIC